MSDRAVVDAIGAEVFRARRAGKLRPRAHREARGVRAGARRTCASTSPVAPSALRRELRSPIRTMVAVGCVRREVVCRAASSVSPRKPNTPKSIRTSI